MKYIERSVKKRISHLGGFKTEKLVERMREGVPTEEEDLGGAALLTLESLVIREKSLGRKNRRSPGSSERERERERVGEEGNGSEV
jgi:hypothetical protein